jgi:hypothetical protein
MDINAIVMWLMVSVIGLYTWRAYLHMGDPPPSTLPWVPIDANKQRSFVNQTRDAGMYVERVRRAAILSNPSRLFSFKGSTNGYLEYGLTSILVGAPKPVVEPEIIWSGGDADDQISDIVDGGNAFSLFDAIDFGNAFSTFFGSA